MADGDGDRMPENIAIYLNVGGTVFHTSLHTIMEGARCGGGIFKGLCAQILKPRALPPSPVGAAPEPACSRDGLQHVVPGHKEQHRIEFFVDADPSPFSHWLSWLRTGKVPFVEAGPERERLVMDTEGAGFKVLADGLRELVDWRRAGLQALLVTPGANLHGARLQGQNLSRLGFAECVLGRANLSACDLSYCSFRGCDLSFAVLEDSNLEGANLQNANLEGASLKNGNICKARLKGADLSGCDLTGSDLRGADLSQGTMTGAELRGANMSSATLHSTSFRGTDLAGATLPPWDSGLLEGVRLAGAVGWVPEDQDLQQARLRGADLSGCDLSGCDMREADVSGANLRDATLRKANLRGSNLVDANLQNADLEGANLTGASLPPWNSGLLEGVRLAGAAGWVPGNMDLRKARLRGADLSGCDLSGCDMREADVSGANLQGTNLEGAKLQGIRGARLGGAGGGQTTSVQVRGTNGKLVNDLKVGRPVVFALEPGAICLRAVTLRNHFSDGHTAERMEVLTGMAQEGPWTSVLHFTSAQTRDTQTFTTRPMKDDAPALSGWVKVVVHSTYGQDACVESMDLQGEAFG